MAGTIVTDRIESDASYASSINIASPLVIANTISMSASGGNISGNVNFDGGTFFVNSVNNSVGVNTVTANGEKLRVSYGTTVSPSTSGNMTTGCIFQVGDGSQALNLGQDSDGTWYNSAYANNAGVPRNHRWLVGGSEALRIDNAGRITTPLRPTFSATGSGSGTVNPGSVFQFDDTGGSSQLDINMGGSNWNNTTDRFTAPVTGTYMFTFAIYYQNATSTFGSVAPNLNGSQLNTGDAFIFFDGGTVNASSPDNQVKGTFILNLAANDYIDLRVRATGANAMTYYAGHSFFQGFLLG